jgi:flagellar basal body-associated protein FliL
MKIQPQRIRGLLDIIIVILVLITAGIVISVFISMGGEEAEMPTVIPITPPVNTRVPEAAEDLAVANATAIAQLRLDLERTQELTEQLAAEDNTTQIAVIVLGVLTAIGAAIAFIVRSIFEYLRIEIQRQELEIKRLAAKDEARKE